jgi:WD40 repeat protein
MNYLIQRLPVLVLLSLAILFSACGGSASTPPTPIPTIAPTTRPSATPTSGVSGNTLFKTLTGHSDSVESVAFSPDGKMLASASKDDTIKLWDVATGQNLKTFNGPNPKESFNGVAFSPDGTLLAGASDDNNLYLWNLASGQLSKTLSDAPGQLIVVAFSPDGKTNSVNAVAFSPDAKFIASGGDDRTVRIWQISK